MRVLNDYVKEWPSVLTLLAVSLLTLRLYDELSLIGWLLSVVCGYMLGIKYRSNESIMLLEENERLRKGFKRYAKQQIN